MTAFFIGLCLLAFALIGIGGIMFGAWASEKILERFNYYYSFPPYCLLAITITGLVWSSAAGIISTLGG